MAISKQDKQGARTVSDLELRYRFGKSFAEVEGIATDAQKEAQEAKKIVEGLNREKIFELLTEDGKWQGIFQDDDGNVYLNASYIKSGVITSSVSVFIEPGYEEAQTIYDHVFGRAYIPADKRHLYDFDEDGEITELDAQMVEQIAQGNYSLAGWYYAKESEVTVTIDVSSPNAVIRITGTNMWGRQLDRTVGLDTAFLKSAENGGMYRTVDGGEKEWLNPHRAYGTHYRTAERFNGQPVYSVVVELNELPSDGVYSYDTGIPNRRTIVSMSPTYYDDGGCTYYNPPYLRVLCQMGGSGFYELQLSADTNFSGYTGFVEIKYI